MLSWITLRPRRIRLGRKSRNRKKIATIFIGVFFVAVFLFFITPIAFAQGEGSNAIDLGIAEVQSVGLGTDDIRLIIARIIRAVLGLLGIISLSLILYAGYTIMTAAGNEEKVAQGKKILINAVIGLVIIFSSVAIVQFIINSLMKATGIGVEEGESAGPKIEYFAGSGALGDIIKDHYPTRNQTGVKRNTKIIVTFREPMDPSSFIDNTNQTCWNAEGTGPTNKDCFTKKVDGKEVLVSPYYGDCVTETGEEVFDWAKHCDHLKIDPAVAEKAGEQNFHIYNAEEKDGDILKKTPIEAAAMASYDADKNAYVFVFRPFTALGNDTDNVWYTVHLNNDIKKKDCPNPKDCPGAFDGLHYKYYEWQFQTDTNFDYAPPHVVGVYPWPDAKAPRNSIVQINFSEAMDPMMAQGVLKKGDDVDELDFTNIIFNATTIGGEWKITNGYKTVEFVSDEPCGENSCGEEMFCLPTGCSLNKCETPYSVLARTAKQLAPDGKSFEAMPFTGLMDVSGNALDGNNNDVYDKPPDKDGNFQLIGGAERLVDPKTKAVTYAPDNYGWDFKILNWIDRVAPYIKTVWPGLDAGAVGKNEDVKVSFSKMMWMSTLNDIDLEEHPKAMIDKKEVSFYHYISSEVVSDVKKDEEPFTMTHIGHRVFGPNGVDYYYFPIIPHTVKSVNQNCLYPGYGPYGFEPAGSTPTCSVSYDEDGKLEEAISCAPVTASDPKNDTGCVQTIEKNIGGDLIQTNSSTSTCLEYLEDISPPFK